MKKIFLILALMLLTSSICLISFTSASLADVTYPVTELGGCSSQVDCEKYCNGVLNMEQCLNFAEKNGIMSKEEIEEARKVMPFMKAGETPGNCKGQKECDDFCNKDENLNECIEFAKKAGLISQEEYEMVKKTGGKGPGGCKGQKECDDFCNKDENFNTCIEFAYANGLIKTEEYEMAKKTGGKGPGGCKKDECDSYCEDEAHIEECVDFAVKNGMMDAKDAEMAKKTKGKSPGNCKGKEECDAFCKNPDNMEICTNFAIEYGLMSPEETEKMKENLEWSKSSTGQCYTQCIKDAGLTFDDCKEDGSGPEGCKACGDKCYDHNNEKCLSREKWQQLDADCKAKGSGYHLEEVKGDDGYGKECVVDETCVYSSSEEWETQEEKDKKLAEMQKQWDEERARYEAEQSRGSDDSGSGGGCTQPGPEGQCNPGPGAGGENTPAGGSGGTSSGDETGGTPGGATSGEGGIGSGGSSEGDSGSSSGGESSGDGESSSSDSGSSNGDSGVTGAVIGSGNSKLTLLKLFEWITGIN